MPRSHSSSARTTRVARNASRRAVPLFVLATLGAVSGCAFVSIDSATCPTGGTSLTYENFGREFMGRWCQGCHGSAALDHAGAPADFIFDTVDLVRRHRARIFVRAASTNDSMPPGPNDPTLADRNRLAEWLVCGAP